uniref:Uncharacterized protein n=1 Tax=Moniliophthora roreri TaxID=221103 RepID=A0A0W0FVF6_MONRR
MGVAQPPRQVERGVNRVITKIAGWDQAEEVHAPLLQDEAEDVYHSAPDLHNFGLLFGDLDNDDEDLFEDSKKYVFGDYNYPMIDVSTEDVRHEIWVEEERVLRNEQSAWFQGKGVLRERPAWEEYGAIGTSKPRRVYQEQEHKDERVIDHDTEHAESLSAGMDVKLRWQRQSGSAHSHSLVQRHSPPSTSTSRPRSCVNSQAKSPSTPAKSKSPTPLPPDAVDLVVEADSSSSPHSHSRPPLKKIYRCGFVGPDGEQGEVKVSGAGSGSGLPDKQQVETVEEVIQDLDQESEVKDVEITTGVDEHWQWQVATTTTPPAYVLGEEEEEEGNLWAS